MARKKIQLSTDQRPFAMIYHDCMRSELLANPYQKLVYIYLKMFINAKNQCFPSAKTLSKLTKISERKVKSTLNELEKKNVITKENRKKANGGKTSNLYTLHDFEELWGTSTAEETATVIEEQEEKRMIELLKAKGYEIVKKEKESETLPTDQSYNESDPKQNSNNLYNSNSTVENSQSQAKNQDKSQDFRQKDQKQVKNQVVERYALEEVKQLYDYDNMVLENPYEKDSINAVIDILHNVLNTTKSTIRIAKEDKPAMVVIGKLLKLSGSSIMYVIRKYKEQTRKVKNPTSYILTLLYQAQEQMQFDIMNQVQHDMYGEMQQPPEPKKQDTNKFNQFQQNTYDFNELEKILLSN